MKLKITLSFLFISIFAVTTIYAQTIYGRVYDTKQGQPLEGATVYLNGTSIGTITDQEGRFFIKTKKKIKASLIISYVGYKQVVIHEPYRNIAFNIVLQPEAGALEEIYLTTDTWTREKKLREFKKQFLGTTKAGISCIILNEDDIYLKFDERNETLIAESDTPIIIKNNLLGYNITYNLQKFEAKYDQPKRKNPLCRYVYYEGSSFYNNMTRNEDEIYRFQENRQKEYNGSVMHFMRVLVSGKLKKEGFRLFNGIYPTTKSKVFSIFQEPDYYVVRMKQNFFLKYKDKKHSLVSKEDKEEPFIIYPHGSYIPPKSIRFDGDLAYERVGNALPLDYEPVELK